MTRRPTAHNPMVFRKTAKPAGHECPGCGSFIRAELADQPCEGCAIRAYFANPEPAPMILDRCPICDAPAHASETDDSGVCEACRAMTTKGTAP